MLPTIPSGNVASALPTGFNIANSCRFDGSNDYMSKTPSSNGDAQKFNSEFSHNSSFQRRIPGKNNHNAPKLIEKYNNLAREALSGGDKILSENYFQHADHFMRITENKINNKVIDQNTNKNDKPTVFVGKAFYADTSNNGSYSEYFGAHTSTNITTDFKFYTSDIGGTNSEFVTVAALWGCKNYSKE